ncbi:hypothetical protein H5410_036979 [Solanum commersonii]|uniref:Uncharacterized protein n=1 Tax=Solanum commersonii TaxID=4109 RepID=A0A9J5Y509_SOLCO|nr:hypothetical protein H5410_036979 [Solanum commersonii]
MPKEWQDGENIVVESKTKTFNYSLKPEGSATDEEHSEINILENKGIAFALNLLEESKKVIDSNFKGGPISYADLHQFAVPQLNPNDLLGSPSDARANPNNGESKYGECKENAFGKLKAHSANHGKWLILLLSAIWISIYTGSLVKLGKIGDHLVCRRVDRRVRLMLPNGRALKESPGTIIPDQAGTLGTDAQTDEDTVLTGPLSTFFSTIDF